jgi:hypothetical protein
VSSVYFDIALLLAVLAVLGFRLWQVERPKPLRPERLWVLPAALSLLAAWLVVRLDLGGPDLGWLAAAITAGAAVGWMRGRTVRIVRASDGTLTYTTSIATFTVIAGLVALKIGMRWIGPAAEGPALLTVLPLVLVSALIAFQRLEMFLRARNLYTPRKAAA